MKIQEQNIERELTEIVRAIERGESWETHQRRFKELEAHLADIGGAGEEYPDDRIAAHGYQLGYPRTSDGRSWGS